MYVKQSKYENWWGDLTSKVSKEKIIWYFAFVAKKICSPNFFSFFRIRSLEKNTKIVAYFAKYRLNMFLKISL